MKKFKIKNELPTAEKLPMSLNSDFIENTVSGLEYKSIKPEYGEIWDTEKASRLSNPREILEGKRGKQS